MAKIMFLPGAGGAAAFWKPVGDRLPAEWPKHYLSWPGLGDEPPDPEVRGVDDLVAMVLAELDRPVDLVAQSMGGLIALRVALAAPDKVRRIVLTATSGGVPVADLGGADWRANYRRSFPGAATWIADAREDLSNQIGRIASPCLLLWGDADPISPVSVGERLRALLPDACLHVVPGGGHDLARTHAEVVASLIAAHLG